MYSIKYMYMQICEWDSNKVLLGVVLFSILICCAQMV